MSFLIELNGAMHVASVGESERIHALVLCSLHEFRDLRQGLEEAVVAVGVEMDEASHDYSISACDAQRQDPFSTALLLACTRGRVQ